MPLLSPFSLLSPPFPLLSFVYFLSFIYLLSFYAKPLNLVDIDTDSYIEGSLPIFLFVYRLSSLSETHINFYLVQSENILSFLYSQFNIDGYSITYICPSYSQFSRAIWWNTRRVDSFFRLSFGLYEWKQKKGVSHYDLDFISMGCIFFSLISFLFLSFY